MGKIDMLPSKSFDSMNFMMNQVFTWRTLPLAIIGLGIILRLGLYFLNRSLWLDESNLALNIIERSFAQLLQPLDYGQAAPIGFLMVEKAFVSIFGGGEYALRLLPLLSGLVSLPLFYTLAKRSVTQGAVIIGLALFSFSPYLIYYSSEVKQYSIDVSLGISIHIISMWFLLKDKPHTRSFILYGVALAIALWFSHPSLFVIAGSILVVTGAFIKRKESHLISKMLLPCFILVLSFLSLYMYSLRHVASDSMLFNYWQNSFMPLPPKNFSDFMWFPHKFFEIFSNPVGLSLSGLGAFVFIVGFIVNLLIRRTESYLLIAPILIALLASALHTYPFSGRLLLFIVPAVLLFVSEGIWYIFEKTRLESKVIGITLIALMFFFPLFSAVHNLKKLNPVEEIKPIIAFLKDHWHDGDVIYIYYGALPAFKYYQGHYGFSEGDYIKGISSRDDWGGYIEDLSHLRGAKRTWVVFSHIHRGRGLDEEKLFLFYLDRMGKRIDAFKRPGAAIYLYDLS